MQRATHASYDNAHILRRDLAAIYKQPTPGFIVNLFNNSLHIWDVQFFGAPDTLFQGCYFKTLDTRTIPGQQRAECWRVCHTAMSVIESMMDVIANPNPDSPANVDAGKLFREDRKGFMDRIREYRELSEQQAALDGIRIPQTTEDFMNPSSYKDPDECLFSMDD